MAERLSHLQLGFLLASFVTHGRGQDHGVFINIDQFQFPNGRGAVPLYYNHDTLLVRYISTISGPSLTLKCVARSEWDIDHDAYPDIDNSSLTVASKGDVPSHSGTVPFELPSLPDMQAKTGGPSCAFILNGDHKLQSDKFELGFNLDESYVGKTYGIEGEVPNGDYPIITGIGTYDSVPTATSSTETSSSTFTWTSTTSTTTTKEPSTSDVVSSTTSPSLTTTPLVSATALSTLSAISSSTTAVSSAPTAESSASTASTMSTVFSPSRSTTNSSATGEGSPQPTGATGETGSKKGGGLSSAASAGIGAGVAVGAIALLGLGFFFWRRQRQKGKGSVGSSSTPEGNRGEGVAELHGKHLSELSGTDYVRRPPQRQGLGVQRAEVEYGQYPRVELP